MLTMRKVVSRALGRLLRRLRTAVRVSRLAPGDFLDAVHFVIFGDVADEPERARYLKLMAEGMTQAKLIRTLLRSPAFAARMTRALKGEPQDHAPPESVVDAAYQVLLHRPPDPDGMIDHVTALRNGADLTVILERLVFSEEFARLLEAKFAQLRREHRDWLHAKAASPISQLSPGDFLDTVYYALFGDLAGETERARYLKLIAEGMTQIELIRMLLRTPAFAARMNQALKGDPPDRAPAELFVDGAYRTVLGRPADVGGMLDHTAALRNGALRGDILEKLVLSKEFARLLDARHAELIRQYGYWYRDYAQPNERDRQAIIQHLGTLTQTPLISLIVALDSAAPDHLRALLESVSGQLYPLWELRVAENAIPGGMAHAILAEYVLRDPRIKRISGNWSGSAALSLNAALAQADGAYVAVLDEASVLSPHALYIFVEALNRNPDACLVYSDEDKIDQDGRHVEPFFKPHWNPDLFYSTNFLGGLCVWKRSQAGEANPFRPAFDGGHTYDFLLRLLAGVPDHRIAHVPHVLFHRRIHDAGRENEAAVQDAIATAESRALKEHLEKKGGKATVEPAPGVPRARRVVYPCSDPAPMVSLIVPTHDKVAMLRGCVVSILESTDYEPFEVIIVDHDSQKVETADWLDRIAKHQQVRVLQYRGVFNWSAINNMAVRQARGTLLGFLNDDMLIMHGDWLREMVGLASRPEVGVVGAKLLYPNETIQHAGLALGINGHAIHVCRGMPGDSRADHDRLQLVQNYAAVTGACMVTRRAVFESAGGFDEALPIQYNDVDFCLRVRAQGYRVVWTPHAKLYHFETATLGTPQFVKDLARTVDDLQLMGRRWGEQFLHDPICSPYLADHSDDRPLALRFRARKPWTEFLRDEDQPNSVSGFADPQPKS